MLEVTVSNSVYIEETFISFPNTEKGDCCCKNRGYVFFCISFLLDIAAAGVVCVVLRGSQEEFNMDPSSLQYAHCLLSQQCILETLKINLYSSS